MTVLSSENRVLGTGTPLLPRVNLLPPEIAERATFRKIQMGLGAALLVPVGIVGLLYLSASHSVNDAQERSDAADTKSASLTAQTAKYRDVTAIYAAADASKLQLVTAMGDEIRFSQMLSDLSLSVPSSVWLNNLTFTTGAPAAPGAAGAAVSTGSVSVTATAFSHDDVALWLESLAKLKSYADPYFSNSSEALIGTRKTVHFTSTATLTAAAQSGRYKSTAGG